MTILTSAQQCENKVMPLKKWKSTSYIKKIVEKRKVTTGLLVISQMFEKYKKDIYMIKLMIFLKIGFRDINVAFTRVSILKGAVSMVEMMPVAKRKFVEPYRLICQKLLTGSVMICL